MVTASHLPGDRNGLKFFSAIAPSGFSKAQIKAIGALAETHVQEWLERGALPPVESSEKKNDVDWMPDYADSLKEAILSKTAGVSANGGKRPLTGLKIVLNSGNGSGGFFNEVLKGLGADVSASMHLIPDGTFPNGVPNPEDATMLQKTIAACEAAQADLGVMLDTDADRCGFVAPRTSDKRTYEALNRNRLIALLGVVFARERPGCAVVTDSVTSEGLSEFLAKHLGLTHVRYVKGYANVIQKARELTESGALEAELAIETSGHCAMRENGYLDDGTYTAVQIVSLLARERATSSNTSLLDLIANLKELDEVSELRMTTTDGSMETMRVVFDKCVAAIEERCRSASSDEQNGNVNWIVDADNLEGVRIRLGHGQFFMLRKSLHDPIVSLQIEARSQREARQRIVDPLLQLLGELTDGVLDLSVLRNY